MNYYDIILAKKLSGGGGCAVLINKNISSNGTYNASNDNADGYKKVVVSVPNPSTGSLSITSNNTYDVTNYASAVVNVPQGITPTGTLNITSNDTYDVTNYASAEVNVSGGGSSPFSLLNTITVTENVRAVNIDFSPYYTLYDFVILFQNVELTASDYLYYLRNGNTTSGGEYSHFSMTTHVGFSSFKFDIPGLWTGTEYRDFHVNSLSYQASTNNSVMNNLYIYTYTASKFIKAGSVFKIYGGNYADL